MKRLLTFIALIFFLGASAQVEKAIPAVPNPPRLVNDYVKMLTPAQRAALEKKLVAYDDSTTNQIAIVIVNDLKGYEADEYAAAITNKWGIGRKGVNNGVIILVSTGGGVGNRAAFVGYGAGFAKTMSNEISDSIVKNDLVPNLKSGNYYKAFDLTTDDIIKAVAGKYKMK